MYILLNILAILCLLAPVVLGLRGLYLFLFKKGKRIKGLKVIFASFILVIFLPLMFALFLADPMSRFEAKSLGFDSYDDKELSQSFGIEDSEYWKSNKERLLEERRIAEEKDRIAWEKEKAVREKEKAVREKEKAVREKERVAVARKRIAEENRLAALRDTGMWIISNFVDDFGEKTSNRYIGNRDIHGKFSNSATTNSSLIVNFLISLDSKDNPEVRIMLDEYGRSRVKASYTYPDSYTLKAKRTATGELLTVRGTNNSDRITFRGKASEQICKILSHDDEVKFFIVENTDSLKSSYNFKIANSSFFKNAYRILKTGE